MLDVDSSTVIAIVVASYIIAFFLAFGVGANDVANSFGTSVGSGVLTIRQACFLATIFEISGAALLGYKVSETVRLGVFDIELYKDEEQTLMLGYLSALIGGAIWNLAATFLGLPISGTHSIIGAVLGFTLVPKGFSGMKWNNLLWVTSSWVISPFLSGIISIIITFFIIKFITEKPEPLESGLLSLPFFYGATILVNLFTILHDGPSFLYLDQLTWWAALLIASFFAISVGLVVWFVVVPMQRKRIHDSADFMQKDVCQEKQPIDNIAEEKTNGAVIAMESMTLKSTHDVESAKIEAENCTANEKMNHSGGDAFNSEKPEIATLFKYLQILTACFGSFAHGANDVSNAIGPLIAVVLIHQEGNVFQTGQSPYYLMIYGGIGISVGLIVWGSKVIKTIGSDLTTITPSTGFSIEIGSAATVLLASKAGIPISTTHCKVGSVICVGAFRARALGYREPKKSVDWKLFGNIAMAWILTVPLTAVFSAASMYILTSLVPSQKSQPSSFF